MAPPRKTKRFGPLFYTTLAGALLIIGGFYLNQFWNARSQRLANLRNFKNLENTDPNVRWNALIELHECGTDCFAKLIEFLDHEDPGLRRLGVQGLRGEPSFLESGEVWLPLLFDRLKDTNNDVAYQAGETLQDYSKRGRTENVSKETIQFLFSKLPDETSEAEYAITLLRKIGQTTPSVAEMLKTATSEGHSASVNEGPNAAGSPKPNR